MTRPLLYISVLLFSCSLTVKGQFFKKKKEQQKSEILELNTDSVTIEITEIVFKNINKLSLYSNPKQLKKIDELEKAGKWKDSPKYGTFKTGYIGFQDHDSPLWLKNIKIKKL